MKRKQQFLEIAEMVNILRNENQGKTLSIPELKDALSGILPTNDMARTQLLKANIIVRTGYGAYSFPEKPVHWSCIQQFYDLSRKQKRKARARACVAQPLPKISSKYEPKVLDTKTGEVHTTPKEVEYSETEAIAFLRGKGYIILRIM